MTVDTRPTVKTIKVLIRRCSGIAVIVLLPRNRSVFDKLYLDGHPVAALGSDDPVVPVVVDHVVVNRQEIAVVVRVEAVPRVVVHLVPPPVSLLVAVRVDPEVVVVYVRIVDVAVDVDIVEHVVVTLVDAKPTDLARWMEGPSVGSRRVEK